MRKVTFVALLVCAFPASHASAAPLQTLDPALTTMDMVDRVQYRHPRDYASEVPWRDSGRRAGRVPPPVGGGGGESFSNGFGFGGGDTASNGTAAYWGTNSRAFSGN